jgi:hypothetical protein
VAYLYAGFYTTQSIGLIPWIVPSIIVGVPIGAYLIRQLDAETFRRICMSFDAWVVAFGLSRLLQDLGFVKGNAAYLVMVVVGLLDSWLLYRFFSRTTVHAFRAGEPSTVPSSATQSVR